MDTVDPAPPPPAAVTAPATPAGQAATPYPDYGTDLPAPAYRAPTSERVLDPVALLVLIALSAAVFTLAGPGAFTAVTSVGMGLFATWRSSHPRPPHR
jgi:hypothetical protein